jgi:hypothetical protein
MLGLFFIFSSFFTTTTAIIANILRSKLPLVDVNHHLNLSPIIIYPYPTPTRIGVMRSPLYYAAASLYEKVFRPICIHTLLYIPDLVLVNVVCLLQLRSRITNHQGKCKKGVDLPSLPPSREPVTAGGGGIHIVTSFIGSLYIRDELLPQFSGGVYLRLNPPIILTCPIPHSLLQITPSVYNRLHARN